MKFIFKNKIIFFLSISLSVIFSQKSIAIVTKKTGNVDYKYYLNKSFSSDINFFSSPSLCDLLRKK